MIIIIIFSTSYIEMFYKRSSFDLQKNLEVEEEAPVYERSGRVHKITEPGLLNPIDSFGLDFRSNAQMNP